MNIIISDTVMATAPMARMDQLDKVEKEVVSCLHTAGMALQEVGKDKPSQKQVLGFGKIQILYLCAGGFAGYTVHELSADDRHESHRAHQVPQSG